MNFKPMGSIFQNQKMWGCECGDYTYLITQDQSGYSASAKNTKRSDAKVEIIGTYASYFTFDAAKNACLMHHRKSAQ